MSEPTEKKFSFNFAAPAVTDDGAGDVDDVSDVPMVTGVELAEARAEEYTEDDKTAVATLNELDAQVAAREAAMRAELRAVEEKYWHDVQPMIDQRAALVKETAAKGGAFKTFWMDALKTHPLLATRIEEHDEAVLEHLTNIRVIPLGAPPKPADDDTDDAEWAKEHENVAGFEVVFEFATNEHFLNATLSKKFWYEHEYPGAVVTRTEGCDIEWRSAAKNCCVELVKEPAGGGGRGGRGGRRGRGRGRGGRKGGGGAVRVVEQPRASFFHFFDDIDDEAVETEDEFDMIQQIEGQHFEEAMLMRNALYTHAVQWFTGLGIDSLDESIKEMAFGGGGAFDDDDYDDDEDDEDDDEGYEDFLKKKKSAGQAGAQPKDCEKQQQ